MYKGTHRYNHSVRDASLRPTKMMRQTKHRPTSASIHNCRNYHHHHQNYQNIKIIKKNVTKRKESPHHHHHNPNDVDFNCIRRTVYVYIDNDANRCNCWR